MNKDTLTTILGIGQAAVVAVIDFMATTPADESGTRWTNPVFYLGLAVAVFVAVKAYYTKGVEAVPAKP